MIRETNWAGNHVYRAVTIHRPVSVEHLREIVSRAPRIHALGSRHCFNDIADSAELVSIDAIESPVEIDREAMTVTVGASIRYGTLAQALQASGFALHNMASLPHISVVGAVSTATHGSGDGLRNLATAV
ncbi:MAG: FAD-binding protein, partial [Chloroflexota bacterium]|nr:FAD-binding protein [Chloroflexota bacterium]